MSEWMNEYLTHLPIYSSTEICVIREICGFKLFYKFEASPRSLLINTNAKLKKKRTLTPGKTSPRFS
jgi:hypothetical protein